MAKDPGKKKKKKLKKAERPATLPAVQVESQEAAPAGKSKVKKAIKQAKVLASKASESPLVSEVVAAALVATAAAIKDPKTARKLAAAAGSDLEEAGKKAGQKSDIFWNLALEVARRSLDAMGADKDRVETSASKPKNE